MSVVKTEQVVNAKSTMEMLWLRVRQRGDLPGFSKAVRAILGAMRGDDDREFNMTRTVLSDPALTQKVLRLANSAMYSVFGQGINTVSKAVIVLGTEAIGHLALGLKLIDSLSSATTDSAHARKEMERAVLAGHIARQVASSATTRHAEEAVVCSMLHSLGRMMVSFYLFDRWQLLQARCSETGMSEEEAAREVLGLGLDEIGRLAAQHWGLPTSLTETLQDMPPKPIGEPLDHTDWLAAVSTMSSHCAKVLVTEDAAGAAELQKLADNYADMLGLDIPQVLAAVNTAQQTAANEDAVIVRTVKWEGEGNQNRMGSEQRVPVKPAADAVTILTHGVIDMREASRLASMRQVMTMALETVYQGLALHRAIVFLHNKEQTQYAARLCFGEGAQEMLPRLIFDDAYQPDVFHAALANDKMIFVENAQDASFVNKVPRWWKEVFPAVRSFMVLPLTTNRQSVGFIYGDWGRSPPVAKIESVEIGLLNELRLLVVRAIERHHQLDPFWTKRML